MESKPLNVLITGGGGDIGQSIGKILKSYPGFGKIFATDLHKEHAGLFIFDECYIVKRVTDESYIPQINGIILKNNIDLVISASEPELRFFHKTQAHEKINTRFNILPNGLAMEIGFDKLKTAKFLKKNGFPYPQTSIVKSVKKVNLPCILKSRSGSGSKDLIKIESEEDFQFYSKKYPKFICQEYLPDHDGEFSCGLFRHENIVRKIIFKRKLLGGFSGFGRIEKHKVIEQLLDELAVKLNLDGSINIQLRVVDKKPYIFEINPRFSSTVLFRHMFGFKDVIWTIESKRGLPISNYDQPKVGGTFYKGFSEYICV